MGLQAKTSEEMEKDLKNGEKLLITTPPVTRIEELECFVKSNREGSTNYMSNNMNSGNGEEVTQRCEFKSDGWCVLHDIMSSEIKVTKKVWKYLGKSRGYGYGSIKVTRKICKASTLIL